MQNRKFRILSILFTCTLLAGVFFTPHAATTITADSTAAATMSAAATMAATMPPVDVSKYANVKIGFLYVGPVDDFGYNQAAHEGAMYLKSALQIPDGNLVEQENVPENAEAERVMEQMISDGVTIIFPTSYGHLDPALNVAKKHPEVTFFHMGGPKTAPNVGSFFGQIWQMVYASGVGAGKMTKSNKLGFVAAFPIPQVLLNMNAFELGAKSVNPKATTTVVFTGNWCDPAKLTEAANSLIDQGIDVITQHQDCPKPILEVADRRGILSVGYHDDASKYKPNSWLTGAKWVWGPTMVSLVRQAVEGKYVGAQVRFGADSGIVDVSPFGPNVPADVQALVTQTKADIIAGKIQPFKGPIKGQDGSIVIKDGVILDTVTLENTTNYLVDGVIGQIPK